MNINIFGLGYVGTVTAGCLAREGHLITGIDPNKLKVDLLNQGQSPIIENDIGDLIREAVSQSKLKAITDPDEIPTESKVSLVCVGTPIHMNGRLDLSYVRRACEDIGYFLRKCHDFHVVVIRSTMLPGTMREAVIPTLEQYSAKKAGVDFGVCVNPEFLREGSAVYDFYHSPKTVIGETDSRSGDLLAAIYANIDAPLIRTGVEIAEMVKYTDNAWHALKICFANEIGSFCKAISLDSHEVMEIFCKDKKLNISPNYLRPGFAFGGSCLPKDVRALNYKAGRLDLDLRVLRAILPSNHRQIERGLQLIMSKGKKKIGILGMSFKAGTDDLRESPMVEVIERLIGKGYDVRIYDSNVKLSALVGANRDYILNIIPHISKLIVAEAEDLLAHAEVIVVGNADASFAGILEQKRTDQVVVDLVRVHAGANDNGYYDGICW